MSAAPLPVNCPAPIATLSPPGSLPSVTFSMPRSVTFSIPIDITPSSRWRRNRSVKRWSRIPDGFF